MIYRHTVILMLLLLGTAARISAQDDSDTILIVRRIAISGNKVTKEHVILRELPFETGDTIFSSVLQSVLERSKDNLMNTSLFNFVHIAPFISNNILDIEITITERWYIWPTPIFEHAERNFPAWLKDPEFSKLNYGLQVNWNNFRGRRELIEFKARVGYKEQFGMMYSIPNLGRNQQHGLSFGINKFRQHEIIIRTTDNKPAYLKNQDRYIYETLSPGLIYTWRPGLYFTNSIFLSYSDITLRDDQYHQEYLGVPAGEDLRWFNFSYWLDLDYRDYKVYPLTGWRFSARYLQQGLGLVKQFDYAKSFLTLLGAKHIQLAPRLYMGDVMKVRFTKNEKVPYFFREGIGYNTNLRGFEYYVIDGNSYFISVNNLKYAIVPGVTHKLSWIPMEQFSKIHFSVYANLFFDVAAVTIPNRRCSTTAQTVPPITAGIWVLRSLRRHAGPDGCPAWLGDPAFTN